MTVFGRANHLSISPNQLGELSLLLSAERENKYTALWLVLKACMVHYILRES